MPALDTRTLCAAFAPFRPHLTRPSFVRFVLVAVSWLLIAGGRHTVSAGLVALGLAATRDWSGFYRLFNGGRWDPVALGRALLHTWVARLAADAVLTFVLDDTVLPHPAGAKVFGAGSHRDPVRSGKGRRGRVFVRGHRWVVLALVVRVPFARRPWAVPVLLRLYRTKGSAAEHVKVTEIARALIDTLARWLPGRALRVVADATYTNGTVMRDLPRRVTFVGALREDAVLTAPPPPRPPGALGRRRKKGARLPTPAQLVEDASRPWARVGATLYGRAKRPSYKSIQAQWYKACGEAELRVVVVRALCAKKPWRAFVSTDPDLPAAALLETFAARWSIESFFRDLRQHLGWSQPQVRAEAAVLRLAPFLGLLYGALVLWAVRVGLTLKTAGVPARRWYRRKDVLTTEDLVRAARAAAGRGDLLREAGDLHDLQEKVAPPRHDTTSTIPMAA
jgi:hypothetical protein